MSNGIRVLHVDDEPGFAEMGATYLEREDESLSVTTATSASEGLERLDEEIDCIVSDYDMPGQDGIEFLKAVRESRPDLPFILFTGKGSEEVAVDAIRAGATDYLQKQTGEQFQLLANRIRNAVTQYRAARAERHLRELAETTDRILYIFTHDWSELLFVSPVYEEIWGRSVQALREDPTDFLNGIHPDDRSMVRENMELMAQGETITIEHRVNADEDYGRWVRVRGQPIRDDQGTVVRVAGFATEITDEKHRQEELDHQRSVLGSVVETVPHGILVVDANREFFTYNHHFVEMWDIPPEVVETGDDQLAIESVLDRLEDPDQFVEQVEYFYDHPYEESRDRIRLVDGRIFERYTAPVESTDGTNLGRVWIFQDITTRETRERELTEQNRRLERQNERLEAFASIVSHDLRSPLNVAQGSVSLASDTHESEHLTEASRALDRMERLIDELLTLAKAGEQIGDVETVDLADLTAFCWRTIETGDASLIRDTDQAVRGDQGRLQQLLANLLSNAIQHGGDGVTVTVGDLEDGFYVADDGPGIPAEQRALIFETGYTTSGDGVGFGLSIVKEIVEAHGWTIAVTDSESGGARFEVTGIDTD